MRVIINADDLGIREPVNTAVFELMDRGWITSTTAMANGPAVEQAAQRLRQFPHCSFGVHLNLDNFESLSRHPGFGQHVDSAGALSRERAQKPHQWRDAPGGACRVEGAGATRSIWEFPLATLIRIITCTPSRPCSGH